MLCELRVENLLLIERAQLRLSEGLNVLTGETGAGKTVLAHALDLMMGGRARSGVVRPGASEAYVEGEFALPPQLAAELEDAMPDNAALDLEGTMLVLARRVSPDGRTRAYVNGRSASVSDLRELGSRLLSFYGQHEHRKLTLSEAQLQILDGFCGGEQQRSLRACGVAHRHVRELEGELQRVEQLTLDRDRELELLEHEIAEIETAAPDEREHEQLLVRRERLRRLDALRGASAEAAEALSGELGEGFGAAQLLASATALLSPVAGADGELDALAERSQRVAIEAQDLAAELRSYCEGLQGEEGSLQEVEERLSVLERLMRKHGGAISSVIEHLDRSRARREELSGARLAQRELAEQLTQARAELERHVGELRARRRRAARELEREVLSQLGALAMEQATFEVSLSETPSRASGGDEVRFTIAPNPGVPAAPLREIASGGELSRVMLALATVAANSAPRSGERSTVDAPARAGASGARSASSASSTLVFDEIDAGIGGHTARAVGERLRDLARGRQVLCITHLPQIASLAERHFSVVKRSSGEHTTTSVVQLDEQEVLGELVRMLGADEGDAGARRHARELLRAA